MKMDCETYRERITADPAEADPQCLAHARECAACAAYGERARDAERLIQEALRFDVAAVRGSGANRKAAVPAFRGIRRGWFGAAAALLVGLAVWLGVEGPDEGPEGLVTDVLAHWYEEPGSWTTTDAAVSPAALAQAVGGAAAVETGRLGLVSYARSCYVRGRWIPHLVIQGQAGPVMLLLLPHEPVSAALPMDLPAEGLRGVILPVGSGSVAVLAVDGEPLEPIEERVGGAVELSI